MSRYNPEFDFLHNPLTGIWLTLCYGWGDQTKVLQCRAEPKIISPRKKLLNYTVKPVDMIIPSFHLPRTVLLKIEHRDTFCRRVQHSCHHRCQAWVPLWSIRTMAEDFLPIAITLYFQTRLPFQVAKLWSVRRFSDYI